MYICVCMYIHIHIHLLFLIKIGLGSGSGIGGEAILIPDLVPLPEIFIYFYISHTVPGNISDSPFKESD